MSKQSTTQVGLGCFSLLGLLQIAFVVLRLCGVIQWSWWWVLAPVWMYCLFILFIFLAIAIIEYRRSRIAVRAIDRTLERICERQEEMLREKRESPLDRRLAELRKQREEMERERREAKNSANEG